AVVISGELFHGRKINARVSAKFRCGFFLAVIEAIDLGPFRPGIVFRAVEGWPGKNLDLSQAFAAVAHGRAHTISARIATANYEHVFAFGRDKVAISVPIQEASGVMGQKFHREMDSFEAAALDREIAA